MTTPPSLLGRLVAVALILIAAGLTTGQRPDAFAAGAMESQLLALINDVRETVGAGPLKIDEGASAVARAWGEKLADDGVLSHNPNLATALPPGWTEMGENLGRGGDLEPIHRALVGSPHHYDNIVYPTFNRVGLAIVERNTALYVVQDFMTVPDGSPSTTSTTRTSTSTSTSTTAPPATTSTTSAAAGASTGPSTSTPVPDPTAGPTGADGTETEAQAGPPDDSVAVKRKNTVTPQLVFVLAQLRAFDRSR